MSDHPIERARAEATRRLDDLTAELDGIIASQQADPPDDEHDVEGASVGFERARVTALKAAAEAALAAIDDAATRRDEGTYGRCEACGGPIGAERLEALPEVTTCVACASARR